jgi:hypothetical protein
MRAAPFTKLLPSVLLFLGCTVEHRAGPSAPAGEISPARAGTTVAAPSGLVATPVSETRVDLTWADNATNETKFELYRSTAGEAGPFALWTAVGANATALSDWSAQPGSEYCFRMRAVRAVGAKTTYSEFSNTACATTPLPPPPPPPPPPPAPSAVQGLGVWPYTSTDVWMTWGTQSDVNYRVERSVDGGTTWTVVGTADYHAIFYDSGLIGDQVVCYRIIAFNLGGDAPPSAPDCTAPPIAPSHLVGTLRADGAVDLTWSDNSVVEDAYEVLALITDYNHDCPAGCFDYTDEYTMGLLPANTTSFTCSGCAGWPTYVRARKEIGMSSNSNSVVIPLVE